MPDLPILKDKNNYMNPNMKIWTEAWHNADPEIFKEVYAEKALIFPPNKPIIQGNDKILDFMKGGLGKVDVIFEPENLIIDGKLAFESGIFKDVEFSGTKIIGKGEYSVTWSKEKDVWKVLCHVWSMPDKV